MVSDVCVACSDHCGATLLTLCQAMVGFTFLTQSQRDNNCNALGRSLVCFELLIKVLLYLGCNSDANDEGHVGAWSRFESEFAFPCDSYIWSWMWEGNAVDCMRAVAVSSLHQAMFERT